MEKADIGVEKFKVYSYHMDTKGRLNLTSIAGFLQEVAGNHAAIHQFGYKDMLKYGMLWVLTRMKVVIHKYPYWSDSLSVKTWVVNREKYFSRRDFEIYSEKGELLISAMSGWMLIDVKRKRPQLVDAFPMSIAMFNDKLAINEELLKIDELNFVNSSKKYEVKYSDLDVVQHVNNTQYQRIILDTFSGGFRNTFSLKSFEINYLAEALLEDVLLVKTSRTPVQYQYKHEIVRERDNKIICRAISRWDKEE